MRVHLFAALAFFATISFATSAHALMDRQRCGKDTPYYIRATKGTDGKWNELKCVHDQKGALSGLKECSSHCQGLIDDMNEERTAANTQVEEELKKKTKDENDTKTAEERKKKQSEFEGRTSDRVFSEDRKVGRTENLVKAANLANQGAQLVGSNAVSMIGQAATQKLGATSKMSESLEAAKKTTKTAQWASQTTAALNGAMALAQQKRVKMHKENAAALEGCKATETAVTCSDAALAEKIQAGADESGLSPRAYLSRVRIEQSNAIEAAKAGRSASLMLFGQQSVNAAMTAKVAQGQQQNIDAAKKGEATQALIGQGASMLTMNGTMGVDQSAATANPSGDPQTADDDGTGDAPQVDLGGPSNPFGGEMAEGGPAAGQFKAGGGGPAGPGGGGGMPSVGGGGAPPSGGGDDPKAQYVANFEGRDRYESGGSMVKGGGGNGGKAGDAKGGGDLDFNSLLAQFLPKSDGGEAAGDQGILEYGAGRAPAAEAPAASYLDKNADIFQRIHQTYQEKQGRGHVGI